MTGITPLPLLHSADEDGLLQKSLSFSTDEEELVGDCDESSIEEWEEVEDINRVPYLGLGDRLGPAWISTL